MASTAAAAAADQAPLETADPTTGDNLGRAEPQLPAGMTKRIIQEGEGSEHPEDGCEVTVHYTGIFEDGKEFDSSHNRESPFNFTLGTGSVIKGWDIGVKTMRRNEIAEFSIPPELAYGERGSPPVIPANARLNFIIDLMDWVSPDEAGEAGGAQRPVYQMSLEERIARCQERKDAGGNHFREGKYDLAIRQYRDIMKFAEMSEFADDGRVVELDSLQKAGDESEQEKAMKKELKQLLLVSRLNLALCYLKLDKPKECIVNCDQALQVDPNNIKAHFRKGLAYLPTNDYEKALEEFEKVLELEPNNAEAKAKKNECNLALKKYYEKQKDIYKNLFAKKT